MKIEKIDGLSDYHFKALAPEESSNFFLLLSGGD
jgi:hypothetical protein